MHKQLLVKTAILMLTVLLSACVPGRKMSQPKANQSLTEPAIVFLVFKISNDSVQGKTAIELISQTRSTGRIKEDHEQPEDFSDCLTLEVTEPGRKTQIIQMEHPLHRRIEYVDEHGVLAMKEITPNEAEFFVRIQVYGRSAQVKVSETLRNSKRNTLQSFKIEER
jgi:hypothetical protein